MILCIIPFVSLCAQGPEITWHKGFGTDSEEHVHEGFQTSDGGFLGVGQTWESGSEYMDMLVVKADSSGKLEWQRIIGTEDRWDVGICAMETTDGYYIGGGLYSAESNRQQRGLVRLDL